MPEKDPRALDPDAPAEAAAPAEGAPVDAEGGSMHAQDRSMPAERRLMPAERGVLAAVAVGGTLGAEARYGIDTLIAPTRTGFPWATFAINVSGCLVMGALMVVLTELVTAHRLLRPFLGVGILGGFTTFSGFTVDTVRLLHAHRATTALAYVVATLVGAAAALALATIVTRRLGRLDEQSGRSTHGRRVRR